MDKIQKMALTEFEIKRIEKLVGQFIEKKRPAPHLRDQVDLAFRMDRQSVVIYEIRAKWDDPATKIESPIAKTTYTKTTKAWKLFWMRADSKWHGYKPFPTSPSLEEVLDVINEDTHCCFWG
ncbi:hypothetical protein DSLASN_00390 [Desulfoluna limicola]|uniref:DUF3024 domain-containing protein n=1 Tax=Desulfoluna limicola TaxID=2810562 RepID=A0ABN6EVM9_9BACT|nr:DUF3024 domain-containing protein [Desulfoluna limicola]BCS94407.1 hypothetical protein DSLASN_00390 [Desulfoluna limicola]